MERDEAWRRVFAALPLDEVLERDGLVHLAADDLKRHGAREPRLMAKIDTLAERPAPLAERALALFPVKNGRYVLFPDPEGRSFFRFPEGHRPGPARAHRSRADLAALDTFPRGKDWSESQALDFAHLSGLLPAFCGGETLHLTLRGRFFSGDFGFPLPGRASRAEVSRVQIELDAGYEGEESIVLVEAKRGARSDFHVRQLWYPWLHWAARSRKRVVPIFYTYSNGLHVLTEFAFGGGFGELEPVRTRAYLLDESPLADLDLPGLLAAVPEEAEPDAAFPQANDLDKVADLVQLAAAGGEGEGLSKARIAEAFGFDERQGDYYGNAGLYLGLLRRGPAGFEASPEGHAFASARTRAERTAFLARRMAAIPSLRRALDLLVRRDYRAEKIAPGELAALVPERGAAAGSGASTALRRAGTIRAWIGWIMENIKVRVP